MAHDIPEPTRISPPWHGITREVFPMFQEVNRNGIVYGYSTVMNTDKLAKAMNLKAYDVALPQPWVDEVTKLTGESPYEHFVWYYDLREYSAGGVACAVTKQGHKILVKYADMKSRAEDGCPTKKDYQDALLVQSACNPRGILTSLVNVMPRIVAEDSSTDAILGHPIFLLFIDKLASLAHNKKFSDLTKAYEICRERGNCDTDGRELEGEDATT